jgi:protein-disulfide isomerase
VLPAASNRSMRSLAIGVSDKDHVLGDRAAPVTLVEYGDFECPDAGTAYPMVKELRRHFGERLQLVFRNFPLRDIHPMAEPAARMAEYAAASGRFWEMHDALYENQEELSMEMLLELAQDLGLAREGAEEALDQSSQKVEGDIAGGRRSGVHGTPTFFINGQPYDGEWEFEELVAAIETELAELR